MKMKVKITAIVMTLAQLISTSAAFAEDSAAHLFLPAKEIGTELYVAKTGKKDAKGTKDDPFDSIETARDYLRTINKDAGVKVILRGGDYIINNTVSFDERDSGTKDSPVVYEAYPGETVRFLGGREVDTNKAENVTDPAIAARLKDPQHTKQINLKEQGITDYGKLGPFGDSALYWQIPRQSYVAPPVLLWDGEMLELARWPNDGYAEVESVLEAGTLIRMWHEDQAKNKGYVPPEERGEQIPVTFGFKAGSEPSRWSKAKDAWVAGFWGNDWADQAMRVKEINIYKNSITTENPSTYGIRVKARWYAYNLLEEIDVPGEYYLDRESGILYFYPIETDENIMHFSVQDTPVIEVKNASDIIFDGIDVCYAKNYGYKIKQSDNVVVKNSEMYYIGTYAVDIEDSTNCGVLDSQVYNMMKSGISVSGGDRVTLTPANNYVKGCSIHDVGLVAKTYVQCVNVSGVGNIVAKNTLYNSPFQAIQYAGNDIIMEYNHIYNVCQGADDCGAFMTGRSWTTRGNIIRYNYVHDVVSDKQTGVRTVMLDDYHSSTAVENNIFVNCTNGVGIHSGQDNKIINNLFYKCGQNGGSPYYIGSWGSQSAQLPVMCATLDDVPYQSEIWREKYPELTYILEQDNPLLPYNNIVKDNISADCTSPSYGGDSLTICRIENNKSVDSGSLDAVFTDIESENYALTEYAKTIYPFFEETDLSECGAQEYIHQNDEISDIKGIVLRINSPFAISGGKKVRINKQGMVTPLIRNNCTMVPLRFVSEVMGALVEYNDAEKSAYIKYNDKNIKITKDSNKCYVNESIYEFDTACVIINSAMYVPVKGIAEIMGKNSRWYEKYSIIAIDEELSDNIQENLCEILGTRIKPIEEEVTVESDWKPLNDSLVIPDGDEITVRHVNFQTKDSYVKFAQMTLPKPLSTDQKSVNIEFDIKGDTVWTWGSEVLMFNNAYGNSIFRVSSSNGTFDTVGYNKAFDNNRWYHIKIELNTDKISTQVQSAGVQKKYKITISDDSGSKLYEKTGENNYPNGTLYIPDALKSLEWCGRCESGGGNWSMTMRNMTVTEG